MSEDEEYVLENVKPNIYQTQAGKRRAKVPDREEELRKDLVVGSGAQQDPQWANKPPTRARVQRFLWRGRTRRHKRIGNM